MSKKNRKNKPSIWRKYVLVVIILCATIITAGIFGIRHLVNARKQAGYAAEMRQFWNTEVNPLREQVSKSTYHLQFINDRFKTVGNEIIAKYGKAIRVVGMGTYHYKGPGVLAMCRIEEGIPTARLSLPSMMDSYKALHATGRLTWHDEFEVLVVATLLHELEHVAEDPVDNTSFDTLVTCEAHAWASTCIYVLVPLHERGLPIPPGASPYLVAWLQSGQTTNRAWTAFVRRQYNSFQN